MRRNAADILFVYHYTHRPPSSLSSYLVPSRFLLVSLVAGPSSLSSPLVFPPLLVLLFSSPPAFPPCCPSRIRIYFILLLNKPLPVILAPHASLHVYTGSTSNTVSTWREDRLTRPFQTRKTFFLYSPLRVPSIIPPSRVPSVIWERWARLSRLLKGFHLKGIQACAWVSAIENSRTKL